MHGNPRKRIIYNIKFRKEIKCAWINQASYNAEEFEVQPEIPAPRRKRNFHPSSSLLVSKTTPQHNKGKSESETPQYPNKTNVNENNLDLHGALSLQLEKPIEHLTY